MKLFFQWLVAAIAIAIAAYLVPGVSITPIAIAVAAVVIAALNLLIRPVLFILTLPLNILTLGLFTFVINALLVMLAAAIVPGFTIAGFWQALLFGIVLTIVNWVFYSWRHKK